ncbi:unnamed protein product [Dibothriocephalus latus]|uniref:Uncharacterized protein n=1 Tax=Dibothriocephalus latus TaxID=60516 RepID=A0A3P7KZ58_DIBLA|nr:unnamed protein product [Dibothriocephalus latus]
MAKQVREHKAKGEVALEIKCRMLPSPILSKDDKLVHNLSLKELTEKKMRMIMYEALFNTADANSANMVAAVKAIHSQTEAMNEAKTLLRHQVSSLLRAHRPRNALSTVEC